VKPVFPLHPYRSRGPGKQRQGAASQTKGEKAMTETNSDIHTHTTNRIVTILQQEPHPDNAEYTGGDVACPPPPRRNHHRGNNPCRRPPMSQEQRQKLRHHVATATNPMLL
jgi:hypothetical protein